MPADHMPEVVGLCPDPACTKEFYMPHGGPCPMQCDETLVEYVRLDPSVPIVHHAVMLAEVERLRSELERAVEARENANTVSVRVEAENQRLRGLIGDLYVARGGSRQELYTAIKRAFRAPEER